MTGDALQLLDKKKRLILKPQLSQNRTLKHTIQHGNEVCVSSINESL